MSGLNPFTATTDKISGAEICRDAPANSIFSGPITSTFNALRFRDYRFTCQYNKEDKKVMGLNFTLLVVVFK